MGMSDGGSDPAAPTASAEGPALVVEPGASLAERTSMEVGGPAGVLLRAGSLAALREAFDFLRARDTRAMPLSILGGGSNVIIADDGVPGVVLSYEARGVEPTAGRGRAAGLVRVAAGTPWDEFVRWTVERGLTGVECLSGIPGWAGAAPIQNIGAYGQEVADVLEAVEVVDLEAARRKPGGLDELPVERLGTAECGLGYRRSHFQTRWRGRYLVVALELRLAPGGAPEVRYPELRRALDAAGADARDPAAVRREVLALRRAKGMLGDVTTEWDPPVAEDDPERRSAGSYFKNPVVSPHLAAEVAQKVGALGLPETSMPRYPVGDGQVKLSAAWLIERAGFTRGLRRGNAAISTRHTLALVNRGGATAREVLALADEIERGVMARFGVALEREPVLLGFSP